MREFTGVNMGRDNLKVTRFLILSLLLCSGITAAQQDAALEDKILERGEKLLEESKAAYEEARDKTSVPGFVDAGFKLEEARIKFIVLQEIGGAVTCKNLYPCA